MDGKLLKCMVPAIVCVLLFSCASSPVRVNSPFAALDAYVLENGGWSFNHYEQARIFGQIRKGLAADFTAELARYVDADLERAYWCGVFLTEPDYAGEAKPDWKLAAAIFELGLQKVFDPASPDRAVRNNAATQISIRIQYLLVQFKLRNLDLAGAQKRDLETLFRAYPSYAGAFPVLSAEDLRIYDSL